MQSGRVEFDSGFCDVWPAIDEETQLYRCKYDYWAGPDEVPITSSPVTIAPDSGTSITYKCYFSVIQCEVNFYNVYGTAEAQRGTIKKDGAEVDNITVPFGTGYAITEDTSHTKVTERE